MRFEDEQYVRLYKRDTTTWLMLNWQGRCVLPLILRKLDRAGIVDLGEYGVGAIAAHIQVPLDVVDEGMKSILALKILLLREDGLLVWPKFIEAQEATHSDKARRKSSRDRIRDLAAATARGAITDASSQPSRPEKKAVFIYFIARDADAVKIGIAFNVWSRFRTLQRHATGRLTLLHHEPISDAVGRLCPGYRAARETERRWHTAFAADRIVGEWFRPSAPLSLEIERLRAGVRTALEAT